MSLLMGGRLALAVFKVLSNPQHAVMLWFTKNRDCHPHSERKPLFPTRCSWLFCFFLPQVFSNTTNVSKFGSADFQQQLSNRTDGTSSVKPRVHHYSSFPAILFATYATPAPTASATTLPAGRTKKMMYKVCTQSNKASGLCKWGPRFLLILAEMSV